MRKLKSVYKIDFATSRAELNFYNNLFYGGTTRDAARQATQNIYGYKYIHVVANNKNDALKKFNKFFENEIENKGYCYLTIDTVALENAI